MTTHAIRFQLKTYGTEAVAFDTASGDTHYLAPFALTLFQLVHDHPGLSRSDVCLMLAQRYPIEPGPLLDARFDEALGSLRRIGLVRLNEAAATLSD
jgi:PqqD family protein of HPr-rel-A system